MPALQILTLYSEKLPKGDAPRYGSNVLRALHIVFGKIP